VWERARVVEKVPDANSPNTRVTCAGACYLCAGAAS